MLYLFEVIWNPRWRTWPLTGLDIIDYSDLLHVRSPNLSEMFLYGFWRSIVNFNSDSKFKIAALESDWWRHFLNYSIMESQDLTEIFLYGFRTVLKRCCCFSEGFKVQNGHPSRDIFYFCFSQNNCIWYRQKCSSSGSEEELLLWVIRNTRWLPWPLIFITEPLHVKLPVLPEMYIWFSRPVTFWSDSRPKMAP